MGLREKQKASRNRAIVEAASRLFQESGYEAARIGQIAELAEVSVGTLYNYFKSKADLLLAIVSLEVEEVLHQGKAVLEEDPKTASDAVYRLASIYYDHSLVYLTKEMWRTAMALAIQHPDTPFSDRYHMLDAALAQQVKDLCEGLRARGLLCPEVDPDALGEALFLSINGLFTAFTVSDQMTLEDLRTTVARHIRAVCG
ncbi:transcriptional regulator, TetR family [Pseudooceanicola nitratireducens]|uniref:Transcriptional regulator, TetR family n=1 Tax=Pseudooceanicola nitratireducens TaxID=517719 RepID=A0A1I1QRN5_9RHOB|nr:TetR/AcrR family transcriptional regulator [Pseudooceanicola nitratireducens]SEJ76440.1 transcriptional regulator, TetR family [Pseudooceanicola nitratireducens]SFD24794.1 transcriptional regulator, TetR family [Pseudooceanicola nitratireducens]